MVSTIQVLARLTERNWEVSLGVNLMDDEYNLEEHPFVEVRDLIYVKLLGTYNEVADHMPRYADRFLAIIQRLKKARNAREFDAVFSHLYDLCDEANIWAG